MKHSAISIIKDALIAIGEYQEADVIHDDDAERAFKVLNRMAGQWSNQNLACFAFLQQQVQLVNNKAQYTIGPVTVGFPTPDIVSVRPLKLEQAYLVDPQQNRYYISIDTQFDFNLLANQQVTSQIPTDLFYDPQSPIAIINLWPVPINPPYTLCWTSYLQLNEFPNLAQEIDFPLGYDDALTWNLMARLCPYFGKAVPANIQMLANDTLGVIKRKNTINQPSYYDPELNGRRRGGFNILSGSWNVRGP